MINSALIYAQDKDNDSLIIKRNQNIDSVKIRTKSSLDTIVKYQAKDSLIYNLKAKTLRLKTQAKIDFKTQKLTSDHIILNFETSTLEAVSDSAKSPDKREYPKFIDDGQSFVGSRIFYNFDTKQGTVNVGETEMAEGYYYGKKIKRVSDDELFVQDGCYTNCDKPHPHYYFGSPQMKVKVNDKVFIDPIIVYVEDLPVAAVPIGLFFPINRGRQSGLILPTVFYSQNRGMTLENLGLYLALSDYYDTKFLLNFYTKGGFMLSNEVRWKLKRRFEGNSELSYGYTRYHPDEEYRQNWRLRLTHNQDITPQMHINANVEFASEDFNRMTSNNIFQRSQQNISSNASFNESFDNGMSYSINFSRNQNIIDGTYSQTLPSINFNMPTLYPLKKLISPTSSMAWMRDITFSYNASGTSNQNKNLKPISRKTADTTIKDTTFEYTYSNKIMHSPSISISPKLGYFTVNPYINFSANNYFRRSVQYFDYSDSTVKHNSENGFFTEYNYSVGANISTTLWGVLKTDIGKLAALRHQFKPSIGYSYSPDLSDPKYNLYGSYYDTAKKVTIKYSRFALDGGGIASRMLQSNLNFSFDNAFSMSLKQDTGLPKKVDLFRFSISSSYNFAADSLNFSNINVNFSTPAIGKFNFNGSTVLNLYDEILDTTNNRNQITKINKFLFNNNKGLAQLNYFNVGLSTSLSSEGFFPTYSDNDKSDSLTFGERFSQRINTTEAQHDTFGDDSPGYDRFSLPWSLNLNANFSYSKVGLSKYDKALNIRTDLTFKLTPTWNFQGSTGIDVLTGQLSNTSLRIFKEVHCWELSFEWYPIGVNRGFYLRFSPKAQNLKDVKIEKRGGPMY